jgi:HSP20 family protein
MTEHNPTPTAVDTPATSETTRGGGSRRPPVDILEDTEALRVVVDLPGVSGDNIDVRFDDGALTVHGKVAVDVAATDDYLIAESGRGDFLRTFQVGEMIDANRISAEHDNGVLTLTLPKIEAVKPRKIPVSVH